jgi:hypothetical protein
VRHAPVSRDPLCWLRNREWEQGPFMKLQDQDVVEFLSGENTVRDGMLVSVAVGMGDDGWHPVVTLVFNVPRGIEGDLYRLELTGDLEFDYVFSSDYAFSQIEMMKCLWTGEGQFYLSLDPWLESERFISDQDCAFFKANSARLTVERSQG